jgi:subtilisin family serine protease
MAQALQYYSGNKRHRISVQGVFEGRQSAARATGVGMHFPVQPQSAGNQVMSLLAAQPRGVQNRFAVIAESHTLIQPVKRGEAAVIPTETVAVVGAKASELKWARNQWGLTEVQEGSHGKVLLGLTSSEKDPIAYVARAARALYERGNVDGAHPNFLRLVQRPGPATSGPSDQWSHDNDGHPGVIGADVAALAAWTITKGERAVRVAVLDEGVDTTHPYLEHAVVAERDFVDGNPTAQPAGDDAHGTACAGIVAADGSQMVGLAPGVSLVAARIAKGDGGQGWIFDDFNTADAIDWCWDDAKADVLSNSWGGGPPVDVITAAFERARTRGRGRKGSVVVIAAGNEQGPVGYPGDLQDVLTVGASNQWDERKTRTSADGENWWGSNFGDRLDVMAPGVQILTTDIQGRRGYGTGLTTSTFNGTSSATPLVAAAAALVLSVRPQFSESDVQQVLRSTADRIGTGAAGWNKYTGHGRVNAFAALRAARKK